MKCQRNCNRIFGLRNIMELVKGLVDKRDKNINSGVQGKEPVRGGSHNMMSVEMEIHISLVYW